MATTNTLPRNDKLILKAAADLIKREIARLEREPPVVHNVVKTPEVYNTVPVPDVKVENQFKSGDTTVVVDTKPIDEAISRQAAVMYDMVQRSLELMTSTVETLVTKMTESAREQKEAWQEVIKSVEVGERTIEFNPVVSVPETKVTVDQPDLKSVLQEMRNLVRELRDTKRQAGRTFTIVHDDGTTSKIQETHETEE